MNRRSFFFAGLLALGRPSWLAAGWQESARRGPVIRGQPQEIYFYPASSTPEQKGGKVLFAPGDLGMLGFAITLATTIASWGYEVFGLDTRHYLKGFTGKTKLKESDVMADFRQVAEWTNAGVQERIALVGWSEGAGLCLLAAAAEESKKLFSGLITLGLSETSALSWYWTEILGAEAKGPTFSSLDYLPKIAPLPLFMIQSSGDQYVPVATAQGLFAAAREPKRLVVIQARNHRFDGNHDELFRTLREGLEWILAQSQ